MPRYSIPGIAVSSCLLGANVRYDGRNKFNRLIAETLGDFVELISVCPETGIGLGVPRPPLKLVELDGRISAIGAEDPALDVTHELVEFARNQASLMKNISGYIFKSRSPSCGLVDTPITLSNEISNGSGIYAGIITSSLPLLPVADEQSFTCEHDAANFLEKVYAYIRWNEAMNHRVTASRLCLFHRVNASVLAERDPARETALGNKVLTMKEPVCTKSINSYIYEFMAIMQHPRTSTPDRAVLRDLHEKMSAEFCDQAG